MARMSMAACILVCFAPLAIAQSDCDVTGAGPSSSQGRDVGDFYSVQVKAKMMVNISVGGAASVTVSGYANILDRVQADVDHEGKLNLDLQQRTCNSNVQVRITVPKPVAYVGASNGAQVGVDTVAGSMWAGFGSFINASELVPTGNSITASSSSGVIVSKGSVDYVAVTASDMSGINLGSLNANDAVISTSGGSTISGMTSKKVTVTVTDQSTVSVRVTENAAYTCVGGSKLTVGGGAAMTRYWSQDCTLETPP